MDTVAGPGLPEPTVRPCHAGVASEILESLASDAVGLQPDEAIRRLRVYGRNELPAAPQRSPLVRFLSQFNNALIYFLLAAAVAAWALGHPIDASVIVIVVLVNATVGIVQEGRAESALNAIRSMISPTANVIRAGRRRNVPVAELVPGDIAVLEAGDRVPADMRLLRARGLLIDEAILTGESVPAEKDETPVGNYHLDITRRLH